MALFESTLVLLVVAIALLQVSRRLAIPYPTILAMAGVGVAALPGAPTIDIEPHLAMALFIAPALLDAAYDFPRSALWRYWIPLVLLAAVAVVVTTAVVAWAAVAWAGLPLYAAIALGAIVSPPDAAAATAMLGRLQLPRATVTVLKGESLLNDAVALLIFGAAVAAVSAGTTITAQLPHMALAVPGGIVFGIVMGLIQPRIMPRLAGTVGLVVMTFVSTYAVWLVAEHLHLSPILAIVAYGMMAARHGPWLVSARDRMHIYAVWAFAVFLLNVLAFLLLGLQARTIITGFADGELFDALRFALGIFVLVVVVRIVLVMIYNRAIQPVYRWLGRTPPTVAQGIVVSWCGMRGLVTLATALALPAAFPGRDLIVLSAVAVVQGTLVLQGLTLGPLIRFLRFPPDDSLEREVATARLALFAAAIDKLADNPDPAAVALREKYLTRHALTVDGLDPHDLAHLRLLRHTLAAERERLAALRSDGHIDDEVFHELEAELDRAEMATAPHERFELVEG